MNAELDAAALSPFSLSFGEMLHLCRHLEVIDEGWLARASGKGLDAQAALAETGKAGSRFFASFASDPETLFERFRAELLASRVRPVFTNGRCAAAVIFPETLFPAGIGENALAHISQLTAEERMSLTAEQRGDHAVNVCMRRELPATWQGVCVFSDTDGELRLLTIFPGSFAPPLEGPGGSRDPFWDEHVLIRKRQIN